MAILIGNTYCYYMRDTDIQQMTISKIPILPEEYVKTKLQKLEKQNSSQKPKEVSRGDVKREKYLGVFKITAYCPKSCCNGSNVSRTATGQKMIPYQTVAVDPKVIPLHSKLKIECNGRIYYVTANDIGGAIKKNKIDMNIDTHHNALNWGIKHGKVWIVQ